MAMKPTQAARLAKLLIWAVILILLLLVGFAVTGTGNENVHNILVDAMDVLRNTSYFFMVCRAKK